METSAKESINVQIAFERVLNEIFKIANKGSVKTVSGGVSNVAKGKSLDSTDDNPKPKDRKIKLEPGNVNKRKEGGCC